MLMLMPSCAAAWLTSSFCQAAGNLTSPVCLFAAPLDRKIPAIPDPLLTPAAPRRPENDALRRVAVPPLVSQAPLGAGPTFGQARNFAPAWTQASLGAGLTYRPYCRNPRPSPRHSRSRSPRHSCGVRP